MTERTGRARAHISDGGEYLITSSPLSGYDIYSVKSADLLRHFGHDAGEKRATSVKFLELEATVITGTTVGEVNIWEIHTGRRLQTLAHHGEFYCPLVSTPKRDRPTHNRTPTHARS